MSETLNTANSAPRRRLAGFLRRLLRWFSSSDRAEGASLLDVAVSQSTGRVRARNEDTVYASSAVRLGALQSFSCGVFVVADGMGGHAQGEAASLTAVESFTQALADAGLVPGSARGSWAPEHIRETMGNAVLTAHAAVTEKVKGGGTTLTAVVISGRTIHLGHVGDSRAILFLASGEVQRLTLDHSMVQRMLDLKILGEAEAARDPRRNVLYRALGQGEPLEVDLASCPFLAGATLLLCSDGLWGVVPEAEISRLIRDHPDLRQCARRLVQQANRAGGPDNISVILVRPAEE